MCTWTIFLIVNHFFYIVNHFFCDELPTFFWFWKCAYRSRTAVARFWPGFWQDMDFIWSIKVITQTTNVFLTNKIGHYVIFCRVRLVKNRKRETLILKFVFTVFVWNVIVSKTQKDHSRCMKSKIFLCDWVLQRGLGERSSSLPRVRLLSRGRQLM